MAGCPKCGANVKEWDLVCPHCGVTLFTPKAPEDSRKVNVDLPDWEMQPVAPEPERRVPPPRPDPARMVPRAEPTPAKTRIPVPEQPSGPIHPAMRLEVPSVPRPDLADVAPSPVVDHSGEATEVVSLADLQPPELSGPPDHSGEATEVVSLADIQPPDAEAPSLADHSDEPTDMISIEDIQPPDPQPAPQPVAPEPVPPQPVQPEPAPQSQPAPVARAAPQDNQPQPALRRKQDTMPLRPMEAEVTQPRAPQPATQEDSPAQPAPQATAHDKLSRGDSSQTINIEEYDPERLKRILAQAQAEAAARSQKDSITPVYYVIGGILALTIIGAAVIIALFL